MPSRYASMQRRRLTLGLALGASGFASIAEAAYPAIRQPDAALWNLGLPSSQDGEARGPNGNVHYWRYGGDSGVPIVVLHGGPAGGHEYLQPYASLATERRGVVLYDQSGCGRSDKPADLSLYTVERYVEELEALRTHLQVEQMVLLGHSWGALLAPAYAAAYPKRVKAMVLAGGAAQVSDYSVAAKHWLAEFGPKAVALVHRVEHSGKTDDPDYVAFLDAYYHRHLCRLDPWPDWLVPLLEAIGQNPVYVHMNGPSEFDFTGTLAGLDLRKSLRKLAMPTLVTCGEYDEAPGWVAHKMASFMPHARVQVFKGLSHMSHIDDPAQVVGSTRRFIDTVA